MVWQEKKNGFDYNKNKYFCSLKDTMNKSNK